MQYGWLLEYIARQADDRKFQTAQKKKLQAQDPTKWKPLTYSCLSQITFFYKGASPNTPNTTLPGFFYHYLPIYSYSYSSSGGGYDAEKSSLHVGGLG